jgi:hypothetical protein
MRGMRCGGQPLLMHTRAYPFNVCRSGTDADEKYVPEVLAYIQNYDFKSFNALLWTKTPEEVVATFPYLSDREKSFACRALFDQWAKCLAEGWRGLPPHLMEWMARQRLNGHAGDDTPGAFDA